MENGRWIVFSCLIRVERWKEEGGGGGVVHLDSPFSM
jgi:hypothetical protein